MAAQSLRPRRHTHGAHGTQGPGPVIVFDLLEQAFRENGPDAVFDLLIRRAREDKQYELLFGARIIQPRHRMGLPPHEPDPALDLHPAQRAEYDAAYRGAARAAGAPH